MNTSELVNVMETLKELGFKQIWLEENGVLTAQAYYRAEKDKSIRMLQRVSEALPDTEIVESYECRNFWPWKRVFVLSLRVHDGVLESSIAEE